LRLSAVDTYTPITVFTARLATVSATVGPPVPAADAPPPVPPKVPLLLVRDAVAIVACCVRDGGQRKSGTTV